MTPKEIIETLGLTPHPEGGWFAETWRDASQPRASGTAIYFLLEAHQRSHWHRVDATETWHWYAGHPMALHVHQDGRTKTELLGPDLTGGQRPQLIVPPDVWQMSVPQGGWVLVGCTVSPGFEFAGFKLAPPGWAPAG
ncbi:MAG: cupin domain-containing protein [Rhodobacteraceae bacterium]|nr:cupin domain-containing protein [Paracoccaceae bacterium]